MPWTFAHPAAALPLRRLFPDPRLPWDGFTPAPGFFVPHLTGLRAALGRLDGRPLAAVQRPAAPQHAVGAGRGWRAR